MSDDIPEVVSSASFTIMGVEIKCHMLSNGQRVIGAESMDALFAVMGDDEVEVDPTDSEFLALLRWQGKFDA